MPEIKVVNMSCSYLRASKYSRLSLRRVDVRLQEPEAADVTAVLFVCSRTPAFDFFLYLWLVHKQWLQHSEYKACPKSILGLCQNIWRVVNVTAGFCSLCTWLQALTNCPLSCSCGGSERTLFRRARRQGLLLQSRQVSCSGPRRAGLKLEEPHDELVISPRVHKTFLYFLSSSLCSGTGLCCRISSCHYLYVQTK